MRKSTELSWVVTSKGLQSIKLRPNKQLPIILPSHSFLIWSEPRKSGEVFYNFLFGFQYNSICIPSNLVLGNNSKFDEFALKVQKKLVQNMHPNEKVDWQMFDPTVYENIDVKVANGTSDTILEQVFNENDTIEIAGLSYKVVKDPEDITLSTQSLSLLPIVGCPVIPTLLNKEGKLPSNPPKIHWYVGSPVYEIQNDTAESLKAKKGKPRIKLPEEKSLALPETIDYIDEFERIFNVPGFEFKHTGPYYIPQENDVENQIVYICDPGENSVVRCYTVKHTVRPQLDEPIFTQRLQWGSEKSKGLRLVTYNILADIYMKLNLPIDQLYFPYCDVAYQKPEYRYALLLKEILGYNADIFCLQEVDERMQKRFLAPMFESLNMQMIYESKRKLGYKKDVNEGTAIVFKTEKFRKISNEAFCVAELLSQDGNDDMKKILMTSSESNEVFLSRPTTVQVTVIEEILTKRVIVCATTHLHFKPEHEHIKAIQATLAIRKIYEIAASLPSSSYIIFAGDLNSLPDGPVFHLLEKGTLPTDHICWKNDPEIVPEELKLLHEKNDSPLSNMSDNSSYTNFTEYVRNGRQCGFRGVLDYVWTDGFRLTRAAPTIPHELVIKYEALPSKIAPSDHLPIILELEFK